MNWLLSASGGSRGCATRLWVSCRPSSWMKADWTQDSWSLTALLLLWVGVNRHYQYFCLSVFQTWILISCFDLCLVSENKVLCHPSSVDSLSTSAATEDHVSMGGWAARKALRVVEHVEQGKAMRATTLLLLLLIRHRYGNINSYDTRAETAWEIESL